MTIQNAKRSLDKVIEKSRVHLYKPIQIAEILHRARVKKDIDLNKLETYRNASKKWRDLVCQQFLGRTSTSSARYQDDIFNENAIPPNVIAFLGQENQKKKGIVEAYIYRRFSERFSQMSQGLIYCQTHSTNNFQLSEFIELFWLEPGLKRSIDKIYEVIVYALFDTIVDALELSVEVSFSPQKSMIVKEFKDFAERVINLNHQKKSFKTKAKIYRVGVTNAADRGMDMWANFGLAIQVKHLSLNVEMAESIVGTVSSDRIVIVCKQAEQKVIVSLLNQLGWKSRIQSIITEDDLVTWYEKALRGKYSKYTGEKLLQTLSDEIKVEFPASKDDDFQEFWISRGYNKLSDSIWDK